MKRLKNLFARFIIWMLDFIIINNPKSFCDGLENSLWWKIQAQRLFLNIHIKILDSQKKLCWWVPPPIPKKALLAFSWIKWRKEKKNKKQRRKVPFFCRSDLVDLKKNVCFYCFPRAHSDNRDPARSQCATRTVLITLNLSLATYNSDASIPIPRLLDL